jgi:hypothetical protein
MINGEQSRIFGITNKKIKYQQMKFIVDLTIIGLVIEVKNLF